MTYSFLCKAIGQLHLTTAHPSWDQMKGIPMDNAFGLEKAGKPLQMMQLYKKGNFSNVYFSLIDLI